MKNYTKKTLKSPNGITLIALVITIIVLLILAGISISMLSGDNSILQRAAEAKERTEQAEVEEQRRLSALNALSNVNETTYQGVKIPAGFAPTGIEGESTVDEGLVIVDGYGNEYVWIEVPKTIYTHTGIGKTTFKEQDYINIYTDLRNHCSDLIESTGTDYKTTTRGWKDEWYDSSSHTYDGENWYTYKGQQAQSYDGVSEDPNGCGLTYEQYKTLYNKMLESVYTNGGFWIGRYEAGTTSPRGSNDDSINGLIPLSQQNQYPINYVSCSQAQTIASRAQNTGNYISSLMFGIQWDLVLKFLNYNNGVSTDLLTVDSKTWGNYYNQQFTIDRGKYSYESPWNNFISYTTPTNYKVSVINGISKKIGEITDNKILLTTGASDTNSKKNIYDLAGNVREFTLEHATYNASAPCAERGGYFGSTGSNDPASIRGNRAKSGSIYTRFPCFALLSRLKSHFLEI